MSNFVITSTVVIPQGIEEISATQLLPLGTIVEAVDRGSTNYGVGVFIYAKGCASTAVGSVALINSDNFVTSLAVAGDKGQIGLAMAAIDADSYGWYQIAGKGVAKVLAGFADNATCYLTATAGSIDDAAVVGDLIVGMKSASATGTPSSGLAEIELNLPYVSQASGVTLADLGVSASAGDLNATTNFEETISATTSEVTIATGKTFNVTDNSGLKLAGTAIAATAAEINSVADTSARLVSLTGSTSLSVATHQNKLLMLNGTGAAYTQTLPAATGSGAIFEFVVGAVNTSNHIITVTGDDVMYGQIITCSTGDTPDLAQPWITAANTDTITLNGTTTGGLSVGDTIKLIDIAADKWLVLGFTTSSGAEATPFSGS